LAFSTAPVFSLRLLLHERSRLFASIGGVTFALLLMLLQVGFRNALLDSAVELLRRLDADIVVLDKEKRPFLSRNPIYKERLYQAASVPGVASASPLWMGLTYWKNEEHGTVHPIRVLGMDPQHSVLLIDALEPYRDGIRRRGSALIDSRSRSSYGYRGPGPAQVARKRIDVIGSFPLGTDFEADGTLLVSEETFIDILGFGRREIEVALVKLEPDANLEDVLSEMRRVLPTDVRAFGKQELIARDFDYWKTGTPVSVILLIGVALGFAVGVVICYQILYTDVLDHLAEFATLKAIGYSDRYIQGVVFMEAVVLAGLGFVPAIGLGFALLAMLRAMSGLPAFLSAGDMLTVGALSLGMCTLAGALALRKVRLLDPAELF
jgi:putative ABC transport system permease protein